MPPKKAPSLRAFWLGQRLKELRESSGLNLKQVAAYIQRDPSTVSRFESGEYPARRIEVAAMIDLFHVSDPAERARLQALGDAVWQTGWWDEYTKDVKREMVDLAWLEERATTIREYEAAMAHGLLQTAAYAEAVMHIDDESLSDEQIGRFLELRMARQKVLDRDAPPMLSAIIDESVLYRPFGGRKILKDQLNRLMTLAERPNIDIRVLPHRAGIHAGNSGGFTFFEMPDPYPLAAYSETLAGGLYVESEKTERFARAYDRLSKAALSPSESLALIGKVAKET